MSDEKSNIIIELPYKFKPRSYQIKPFVSLDKGIRRGVYVWHRRSGKDKTMFNLMITKAYEKVGSYYYFFPTYQQGKKALWDNTDKDGMKYLEHVPEAIKFKKNNDTEMKITLKHPQNPKKPGSLIQIIGTDNYDAILGTNPIGCVFSEYSLQNPKAWGYIRPILVENGGWALFNFLPRGKNHGWSIYSMAKNNPNWDCNLLTVDHTYKDDGTHVVTSGQIAAERRDGMSEDLILSEFYCSFETSIEGAYYARQLMQAEKENRITKVPYDSTLPVHTYWDIGIGDATAIWFTQSNGNSIHIIDCYENQNVGLETYIKVLKEKPYIYGTHTAPHDIRVRDWTSGKSRLQIAQNFGIDFAEAPNLSFDDGIEAVRSVFSRCYFDAEKCEDGLNALRSYHKEKDDKKDVYKETACHDWSSHYADAFRYFAVSPHVYTESIIRSECLRHNMNPDSYNINKLYKSDYDPFESARL